jgi:hypothetical protein
MRNENTRTWIAILLVFSISSGGSILHAEEPPPRHSPPPWVYGLRLGVLAHDVNHLWSRSRKEGGVNWNAELVFGKPGWSIGSGRVLPNIGASINNRGDTSKIYGGCIWEVIFSGGGFFNTGAGLALHDGDLDREDADRKQLGSRMLFRIPFEVGLSWNGRHRLSLMFDHVSNAYLASPNEGLDTLGVRYGFQF